MWNSLAENVTNPNELWAFSYGSQSYDLKDATFTDEKYTFAGWYLNYENGTYSELVTKLDENTALGSDSITLYAKWTITTEKTSSGATVREVQVENLTNEILNLNSEDEFFILVTSESVCAENIRSVNAALKTSSLASFVLDFSGVKEDFVLEDADAENPTNSFYNCTNLTGIILPSSCTGFTSIGKNAFYKTNLYSIVIPKTVTNFCESAFESRNSATGSVYSVYYKGSLNNWMTKLTFADRYSNPLYGDLYVTTGSDENYEKVTELTISNTSGITKIKPYTFSGCKSLDSVKLSSSINTVGDFAFSYSGIKSFSGTSVKELGIATFNACTSLSSVEIGGSIKELKNSLFNMCYSLREFEIPASVTKIDDYAFSASAISTITIPSSVISIGKGAFRSPYPVSQVIITTSGWYVTKTKDSATGTNINLSISSYERAKLLSDTYVEYYWYRSN